MKFFNQLNIKQKSNLTVSTQGVKSPDAPIKCVSSSHQNEHKIYDMHIKSNVIPPSDNYYALNQNELAFFKQLHFELIKAKLNPSKIILTRLSNGCFNVDYENICTVGKVDLYELPNSTSYAVIKKGNTRATKVFTKLEDAQVLAFSNPNYEIQERTIFHETYMHYFIGSTRFTELHNPSLNECIATIPRWIKYIKYCKAHP